MAGHGYSREGSLGGAAGLSGEGSRAGSADVHPDALGASGALLLGHFTYDAHACSSAAVQTFTLARPPARAAAAPGQQPEHAGAAAAPAIDHIRLVVGSNHGHAGYTCLYRLRMHGTPVGPAGNGAPE